MHAQRPEDRHKTARAIFPRIYTDLSHHSSEYTFDRLADLKTKLEEWSGKSITGRVLNDAIKTTNENRRLLQEIARLRMKGCISGVEALKIIGSSYFMDKEEHNRLLSLYVKHARDFAVRPGKKVFVEASPQDNLQLYELIESCGATVVDEDNCWGNRCIDDMIGENGDPLYSIAQRYHYKSPCPYVYFPANARFEYFTKKVTKAKPDGVIFYINENDAGQLWDYSDQNNMLKDNRIPTLDLLHQPYLLSHPDELIVRIREFISSI